MPAGPSPSFQGSRQTPGLPAGAVGVPDEAQPRFMHQGRAIERVAGLFLRETRSGQTSEFIVDEREQVDGSLLVALLGGFQKAGDVSHGFSGRGIACQTVSATPRAGENKGVITGHH
jgi:hypothetical protein